MSKRTQAKKPQRQRYPDEFKAEAIKLAERIGATAAAAELGIQSSQLYSWRAKLRREESSSAAERRLMSEVARLKRELAEQKEENLFLKKASAYFAKHHK